MRTPSQGLGYLVSCVATAAVATAQGSDSCATPTAIAGVGSFAFTNTTATTGPQGQSEVTCSFFGSTAITRDVWFAWTAPSTNTFSAATCGTTSVDTKMAVYAGAACPISAALACAEDSCASFQSYVQFPATVGSTYALQIGTYPFPGGSGAPGGPGTVTIAVAVPCGTLTGPDVIVGDLHDLVNHNVTGSLDALSLGTTSCNLGTANLNWIAATNQHPVIGGNLYRYRVVGGAGRFEQIGMSWLKHGFTALSENLCCVNCNATDGSTLGVGCSDPYDAGLNGAQSGLGPRWQVNAFTGAFTYPPANPSWTGNTARRCEFLLADVDTSPGVRYFGEAQYVTPDDAAAGNAGNNASYRELTATLPGGASGASFALLGTTQREKPALAAWPLVEPGATVTTVDAPTEGRYQVGWKVTNLGGGTWHYEYAVHNLSSHRSCGAFAVPIPTGVTVTNVGFHDVDYRNGDGVGNLNTTGTDWTASLAAGQIAWACEIESVNANANALRWGTTYNFRFDANVPPASGSATLAFWRSGFPGSFTTTVDVPSTPASFGYCFGDGTAAACPCANGSSVGANAGCRNSLGTAGKLVVTGAPSIAADTIALVGSGMPPGPCLYFQGTTQINAGFGLAFGDGLRCVGGTTVRLAIRTNDATGASSFPTAPGTFVSVVGGASAGAVRTYSVWYRDSATFCTTDTFNLTNGWSLTWQP